MILRLFTNKYYVYLGEHGAELDYIVGTILNNLTNKLKNSTSVIQLSTSVKTGVIVGWNYMDAVFDFMFALNQFINKRNYRYKQNILKGVINVLEGIQLFVLSYNPPLNKALGLKGDTALAGTAFAVSTFGDLIVASIDFYNAFKETYFWGWLDETIKAYKYALNHGYETKELVKDIRARCKAYVDTDPVKRAQLTKLFTTKFKINVEQGDDFKKFTHDLDTVKFKHKERNLDIQHDMDRVYRANRTFVSIKAISLVGMVLLAVAGFIEVSSDNYPTVMIIGLTATTVVAAYYSIINAEKLADQTSSMCHRFFSMNCCRKSAEEVQSPPEIPAPL